jgi:hypothetical protein
MGQVVGKVPDLVDEELPARESPCAVSADEGVPVSAGDDRLQGESVDRLEDDVRRAGRRGVRASSPTSAHAAESINSQ